MTDYRTLLKRYQPGSYEIEERFMEHTNGMATNIRKIVCPPIKNRSALFVYLHEVGHVKCGHMTNKEKRPSWILEYEADMFAFAEFRRLKLSVPVRRRAEQRHVLRDICESAKKRVDDGRVLRYAYGNNWRIKYAKARP